MAFAAAFFLTQAADQGLVLAVARARGGASPAEIADEAAAFVRSMTGMSTVPVLNGVLLAAMAIALTVARRLRLGGGVADEGPRPSLSEALRLGKAARAPGGTVATTAGVLGLSLACGAVIDLLGVQSGDTMEVMAEAFRAPTAAQLALALVAIGVVPGVSEELFFRGFVLEGLTTSWGAWGGIVGSAAAFGLIHVEPVQATAAFVLGLFLAWSARRLGSIRPTMAAHAVNNAGFLLLAASGWDETASRLRVLGSLAAGLVVAGAAIAWLLRVEPRARRSTV
jgi:membrane protease YdiL (CAAX protease family)